MSQGKLIILDSRTDEQYEIPIENNSVPATAFKQIKGHVPGSDVRDKIASGLRLYDPGLVNTAICKSDATWVDPSKGELLFRGYSVEQLRTRAFEELFHLMVWGDLPTGDQAQRLRLSLADAMCNVPSCVTDVIHAFPRNSHPMPVLCAGLAALMGTDSAAIPTTTTGPLYYENVDKIEAAIVSLTAGLAVVIGRAHSYLLGHDFVPPSKSANFHENLLAMTGITNKTTEEHFPKVLEALRLWTAAIMDHGQTNSNLALSTTVSSQAHPTSCLISALMAAYGPLHFGAQESAYRPLEHLQTPEGMQAFLEAARDGKHKIHGFGHRSYKQTDVRVPFALEALEILGGEKTVPLLKVAKDLISAVDQDEHFAARSVKPNGDIYGQFIFVAMGFGPEWSPALSFLQRMPGLMNTLRSSLLSDNMPLLRPTDIFVGHAEQKATRKIVSGAERARL